jgi:hypothetical protein
LPAEAALQRTPPLEAIAAMPLCFNPAGCEPDHEPDPLSAHVALRRTTDGTLRTRREAVASTLAEQRFVLVRDVLPFVVLEPGQGSCGALAAALAARH